MRELISLATLSMFDVAAARTAGAIARDGCD